MEGHLEEEHFEKGKGLFEKGHLEKRQLRKGIVEGQFRKGIMEGQSGGALWKGRKGTVHKLEFILKFVMRMSAKYFYTSLQWQFLYRWKFLECNTSISLDCADG